jgi:hypothetical protein
MHDLPLKPVPTRPAAATAADTLGEPAQRIVGAELVEVVEHQQNRLRQPPGALLQVSQELVLAAQGHRHQRGEHVCRA